MRDASCPVLSRVYYSGRAALSLPTGHRYPANVYRHLHREILVKGILPRELIFEAPLVDDQVLALAHAPDYVKRIRDGELSSSEQMTLGLPWDFELYLRACSIVGGTIGAAEAALESGVGGHLGGGDHQASWGGCGSFALFNDVAVAVRFIQKKHGVGRIAVMDFDHQRGRGIERIFDGDPGVLVLGVHEREISTGSSQLLLDEVDRTLEQVRAFRPDFVFFQGGLASAERAAWGMNLATMLERDRRILRFLYAEMIPATLVLGDICHGGALVEIDPVLSLYRSVSELYGLESHPLEDLTPSF